MATYAFQFEDEAEEKPTQWYRGFDTYEAARKKAVADGRGRRYRVLPMTELSGTVAAPDWITPGLDEGP